MSEEPPAKDPLRAFTFAGRLLVIGTVIVAGFLFYFSILFVHERFPAGSYPLAFVLIPVPIGSAVFFGGMSLLLRLMGVRVWKKPDDTGPPPKPPS